MKSCAQVVWLVGGAPGSLGAFAGRLRAPRCFGPKTLWLRKGSQESRACVTMETLSTYHPKTVRGSPVYPACKEDPAPKDSGVDCSLRSLLTAKIVCPLLLQGRGITPTDCRGFCLLLRQLSRAENVPQPPSQTHTGAFTKRPLLRFVWFIKSIYLFYFYSTFGQFHGMKLLRIKP